LLQELNEAGILLENDPGNTGALARVRRAMHTLKGDSAACGFRELGELAHGLEDLLTPALVIERGEAVAESFSPPRTPSTRCSDRTAEFTAARHQRASVAYSQTC